MNTQDTELRKQVDLDRLMQDLGYSRTVAIKDHRKVTRFEYKDASLQNISLSLANRIMALITKAQEEGYIKKESAEYHQQEMMKYKASMESISKLERTLKGDPSGGVVSQYKYHKSMYEQLAALNKTEDPTVRKSRTTATDGDRSAHLEAQRDMHPEIKN